MIEITGFKFGIQGLISPEFYHVLMKMTFFWIKSFDHSDHNCLPPPVFSWKVVRFHGGCLHLILVHAGNHQVPGEPGGDKAIRSALVVVSIKNTFWVIMRQAGTWNPLLNKIQRNHKGLKITACMCSWCRLWTGRYKKTKRTQGPLLRQLLKSWKQKHMPPSHPPKGL